MGENTKIAWADHTFNPWIGCTKVSVGCAHCYAERDFCLRRKVVQWGDRAPRKRTSHPYWRKPYKWARDAAAFGTRPRVFCGSLCDWLDDRAPAEWRQDLYRLISDTPELDWLLLTKRPDRTALCVPWSWKGRPGNEWADGWPTHIWQGVSIEHQGTMCRLEEMRSGMPYANPLRFISAEPLLGPLTFPTLAGIGWVIVGGESGPGARPFDDDWARSIRDQCAEAGVPFFFKQRGGSDGHALPVLDGQTHTATPRPNAQANWPAPAGPVERIVGPIHKQYKGPKNVRPDINHSN